MPPGLNLRALEVFVAVAETRTMALAAERLHAAPSTISQQIAGLEESLATTLVDRSSRPLTLTAAGRHFLPHACRILGNISMARSEMMSLQLASLPSLKFAIIDDFDTSLTPALMIRVHELYPDCLLSAWAGRSEAHFRALLDREADLIVTTDAADRDYLDVLERYPLLQEPLIAVAAPGLIDHSGNVLDQLKTLPFIRYSLRMSLGRIIEAQLRRLRLDLPPIYEFDSSHSMYATVQKAGGWALTTPICMLENPYYRDILDIFNPPFANINRTVSLWARKQEMADLPRQLALLSRRILQQICLQQALNKMPWIGEAFAILDGESKLPVSI